MLEERVHNPPYKGATSKIRLLPSSHPHHPFCQRRSQTFSSRPPPILFISLVCFGLVALLLQARGLQAFLTLKVCRFDPFLFFSSRHITRCLLAPGLAEPDLPTHLTKNELDLSSHHSPLAPYQTCKNWSPSMMTLSTSLDVPRSKTALIEHAHRDIDKEIIALVESIRVLRSHKNALTYTCLLPPEILAAIFIYIAEEQSYSGTPSRCGAPLFLAATHVCQHWRKVALECATLWTSINCASVHWVAIMLERSKKAALVVTYSAPASLEQCFEQVLSQLSRIKVLQLCSFSSDANRIMDYLSSQPAPLLQIFKFSVQGFLHPRIDAIFQGCAPQLRSVELMQCNFSWTLGIFSGLRTLNVRQIAPSSSPTLSQLLSALRHMSGLEQLMLDLLPASSENDEVCDKVSLARLKSMTLTGFTAKIAISLFSHLLLPVDLNIALTLAQNTSMLTKSFGSMRVELWSNILGVQFSTSTTFASKHIWNPPDGDIRLSIQFKCDDRDFDTAFDMCYMFQHCKIQSFFFASFSHDPQKTHWRTASADLPALERIHVSETPVRGLIAALKTRDLESSNIAYPLLCALELEDIDFSCDEPGYLQCILMMRAKCDVGLHKLRLAKCRNLAYDQVQLLQEVVTDVDWDGYRTAMGYCSRHRLAMGYCKY
ncbi:hypothetical protein DFJ58DRAFT_742445 [Suillus subalutaceus]|uniref:uncharacterized protein n=1 Tax=Suillus subalutaceus TaxID=48586 RepID=UPI001B86D7EC|nr:uncharacterized protein DFJ58DRAFT_742445 [Suillus subalutaceus]KAG1869360.1 hypothetical protein DFJ58DRAFT_742445 [Suillus subalutaceus]